MKVMPLSAAVALAASLSITAPVAANVEAQAESQKPISFRKSDDITSMVSKRMNELRSATRGNYSIASGDTEYGADLQSDTAVEEFYAAYKEAYVIALTKLIMRETRAKISSELDSTTGGGVGSDKSNASQCAAEYTREQERLERERLEFERSFIGTTERIVDKILEEDDSYEQATDRENEGNEALSKLLVCEAKQNIKGLSIALGKSVAGATAGVRVMDTLVDVANKRIAVVVGRSPETVEDAGILKAQNTISKPLDDALGEALDITANLLESYQIRTSEPPFGIMGVRGQRLSNNEMLYLGFGTAIQKQVMDEIDATQNSLMIETAQTKGLAALQEFAYISASSDFQYEFDKTIEKVLAETLDMAKRGEKVDVQHQLSKELRATMTRDLSSVSKGFLANPQEMETSAWGGGENYPDFYLSVWAWSPSLMTNASNQHRQLEESYRDGQKPKPAPRSDASNKEAPPGVKSFKVEEDW